MWVTMQCDESRNDNALCALYESYCHTGIAPRILNVTINIEHVTINIGEDEETLMEHILCLGSMKLNNDWLKDI